MTPFPSRRGIYYLEDRPEGPFLWVRHKVAGEPRKKKHGRALAPLFADLGLDLAKNLNDKNVMRAVEVVRAELDADRGDVGEADPRTPLLSLVDRYAEALLGAGRHERYVSGERRRLRATLGLAATPRRTKPLPWTELRHLKRAALQDYLLERAKEPSRRDPDRALSPEEVNHDLRAWKAFSSWLVDRGDLKANPFLRLKQFKRRTGAPKTLSPEAFALFFEKCREPGRAPWLAPAVFILSETGMRPAELARVTWGDVDLRKRSLQVVRKGGDVWTVQLSAFLADQLGRVPRKARKGPLVPGFPHKGGSYCRAVRAAAKAAGLEGVTLYWLRHSVATQLAAAGESAARLQGLMGWRSIRMADRYVRLDGGDLRGAMDRLPWSGASKNGNPGEGIGDSWPSTASQPGNP